MIVIYFKVETSYVLFYFACIVTVLFFCRMFPKFDLIKVLQVRTPVQRKLTEDGHLRQGFVQKYLSVFDNYVKRRAQDLLAGENNWEV